MRLTGSRSLQVGKCTAYIKILEYPPLATTVAKHVNPACRRHAPTGPERWLPFCRYLNPNESLGGVTNAERDRDRDRGALKTHTHKADFFRHAVHTKFTQADLDEDWAIVEGFDLGSGVNRAVEVRARQGNKRIPRRQHIDQRLDRAGAIQRAGRHLPLAKEEATHAHIREPRQWQRAPAAPAAPVAMLQSAGGG